jgi:DNA-binding NarL/FixJ family response regulator
MSTQKAKPVRILLADDSDIMREAIRKLLDGEPSMEIVGEAPCFASTIQAVADCNPDVLLLDLHMPQKHDLQPPMVKSQLACVPHTVAISFANDEEAKSLAASYGAVALLDKMSLFEQLVPALTELVTRDSGSQRADSAKGFNRDLRKPHGGTPTQLSE